MIEQTARLLLPTPELRLYTRLAVTRLLRPVVRQRAARLAPARLHLGSHRHRLPGWTNVDLVGVGADLVWDIRHPLPLPDKSVAAIFAEHFLEHLPLTQGEAVIADCYRLLEPGGVLRISVPDATGLTGEALNHVAYEYGHRAVYDETLLLDVFRAAGFNDPRRCAWGESVLDPAPDDPGRPGLTVEASR